MARYFTPRTLTEACQILAQESPVIAAGCTDLFPATTRKVLPGPVLDLTCVDDMRGIQIGPDGIDIGAMTTWTDMRRANLPTGAFMLQQAAAQVGAVQIQTTGTIGGNLCNASPAADGVPPLLALEAEVTLVSVRGTRRMPLAEFITGPRRTARAADEILCQVHLTKPTGHSRFLKLGARHSLVISIAMVAVRIAIDDGRITQAAISVGACGPVACRLTALEAALIGQPADGCVVLATDDIIAPALSAIDDIRADGPYRTTAAAELVRRALGELATQRLAA